MMKYSLPILCDKCKCKIGIAKHNIDTVKSAKYFTSIKNENYQNILVMLCEKCADGERKEDDGTC